MEVVYVEGLGLGLGIRGVFTFVIILAGELSLALVESFSAGTEFFFLLFDIGGSHGGDGG
jgi:hypothetical protein